MKNKNIFAIVIFIILFSTPAFAGSFCDGFEKGYISGYKQVKNTGLDPLVPLCPLQPLKNFGDPESDFEHGYIIGLKKGTVDSYK